MTDTPDPRGDAVEQLHDELARAGRIPNDALRDAAHRRIHAAATVELVEAVRDLTAIVALAMQPPRWTLGETTLDDEPADPDAIAEAVAEAEAVDTTLGAVATSLEPGHVIELVDGGTIVVTALGTSEGAAWIELQEGDAARRVWLDDLVRDERVIATELIAGDLADLVASAPRVDLDDEPNDDAFFAAHEGGDDDDEFDTVV